jgi:virulence factor
LPRVVVDALPFGSRLNNTFPIDYHSYQPGDSLLSFPEATMLKLGIVDFDTSHCVEFTKRLHHQIADKEQWVDGAKVVLGFPGTSKISPERIEGFTKTMKELGVEMVETPADMIGKVDGVLIEAVDGSVHLERAKPFLEAGIPCFVDKPFACSVADAKAMIDLAEKKKLPMFSSSSLRYAPELVDYLAAEAKNGKVIGANTYGPCSLHDRNPGFFHYGIHAVEMLYALMGPGCTRVTCTSDKGVDLATGHWKDGRVGTIRGIRQGKADYGFTAFAEKTVQSATVGAKFIYRELLKKVVEMFTAKKSPLDPTITLELVAFIEAAHRSGMNHGAGEMLKM